MRSKAFVAVLLVFALLRPMYAQQRVHDQVNKIAIGDPLTVKMIDGRELHGHLSNTEADTFAVREVDLQQTVTILYSEVERVSKDYGGVGFGGRRVNPHHRLLVMVLVVGGLIALVLIAVASDKS